MTYSITERNSEFNIYDIFDILVEYAVPRPGLDPEGRDFIKNLSYKTNSPSWKMVVGFLNRHVFVNASGEHTLRLCLTVDDEKNTRNPTRPFILTQSSNIYDLVKWAKRAGNRRMSSRDITTEMNQYYGGQIRLNAKSENHNVAGLVDIIENGRILNFDNLYRYISIVAPNVRFEIISMKTSKQHRTIISNDFRMEWGVDFTGDVKVFSGGRMLPYTFTDDEDEDEIDEPIKNLPKYTRSETLKDFHYDSPKKKSKDEIYHESLKEDSEVQYWIENGLLDNNLKATAKFFDALINGEIEYNI